jgi:hypothetical protein
MAPNQFNYIGPGGLRAQEFNSWNINLEQRVTRDLTVVASLFHNRGIVNTDGANTALPELAAAIRTPISRRQREAPRPSPTRMSDSSTWTPRGSRIPTTRSTMFSA